MPLPLQPVRLRLDPQLSPKQRRSLRTVCATLPVLHGDPIAVEVKPDLIAHHGKLLSGTFHCGTAVHAAAFIRARRVVLEEALFADPLKLHLIFTHEVFHFVWARAGNTLHRDFAALLSGEISSHARGELGESSAVNKGLLDAASLSGALWRDYVCESFCDTAAWLYCDLPHHSDFTLARRWQNIRRHWFEQIFSQPRSC